MSTEANVLVAGATGLLGNQLIPALLDRGQSVRALVRSGISEEKRTALAAFQARGLEVVEGDITDPVDSLAEKLAGVETVVSAVQGGPDVIVDGQVNLLRAAERAGSVRRFIPSDFAIDVTKLDSGDNFMIDWRNQAHEGYGDTNLKVVSVLNGAFIEVMLSFMELVDWEAGTVSHYGDPDQPLDLTTVPDTAAYTAAIVADPKATESHLRFAGEVLSMRQFKEAVERGSGKTLALKTLGTADELRAEITRKAGLTQNPFDYVALQYQWCMVTGKAKFDSLDNDRYPDIKPVSVEEFVRASGAGAS